LVTVSARAAGVTLSRGFYANLVLVGVAVFFSLLSAKRLWIRTWYAAAASAFVRLWFMKIELRITGSDERRNILAELMISFTSSACLQ
jgi:hypothetical protein